MRRIALSSLILLAQIGCEGRSVKEDFPVFGPPPPRVAMSNDSAGDPDEPSASPFRNAGTDGTDGDIRRTGFDQSAGLDQDLTGTQVVATVNGIPIFADEVLERYGERINLAREKYSPADFRKLRLALIKRHLQDRIDREVLVQSLKSTLKKEQLESVEEQLDTAFNDSVINNLKKELGVNTRHEVEMELQRQGTSLIVLQDSFVNRQMAGTFLASKATPDDELGREQILAWYKAHIDDYTKPAQVKWQQIVIRADKHDGPEGAQQWMQQAADDLRSGMSFEEAAKKYSDGPAANTGGHWDWIQAGSLADSETEDALFALPVNGTKMIVKKDRYILVMVTGSRRAGRQPFEDVQAEIEAKLMQDRRNEASERVLQEIRDSADIATIFDDA